MQKMGVVDLNIGVVNKALNYSGQPYYVKRIHNMSSFVFKAPSGDVKVQHLIFSIQNIYMNHHCIGIILFFGLTSKQLNMVKYVFLFQSVDLLGLFLLAVSDLMHNLR